MSHDLFPGEDLSSTADWKPGDLAWWRYTPRGGYGLTRRVAVTVVSVGEKRVRVRAPIARGGEKVVAVHPANLEKRDA